MCWTLVVTLVIVAVPGVPYLMHRMGMVDLPKARLGAMIAVIPFAVAAYFLHNLANVRVCSRTQQVFASLLGLALGVWLAVEFSASL
ncbi:MAG: hypothetical protein AAF581_10255 [Planctomycetota bacterium]